MSTLFKDKDLRLETKFECDHYMMEQVEGDGSFGFFYNNEFFYG